MASCWSGEGFGARWQESPGCEIVCGGVQDSWSGARGGGHSMESILIDYDVESQRRGNGEGIALAPAAP
jgi:hypothetical protein